MQARSIVQVLALTLAGCAAAPPQTEIITIDSSYDQVRRGVRVLLDTGAPADSVQPITARSCQMFVNEKPANAPDAVAQLQVKASRLGANAIRNVSCHDEGVMGQYLNCATSHFCRAEAVKEP